MLHRQSRLKLIVHPTPTAHTVRQTTVSTSALVPFAVTLKLQITLGTAAQSQNKQIVKQTATKSIHVLLVKLRKTRLLQKQRLTLLENGHRQKLLLAPKKVKNQEPARSVARLKREIPRHSVISFLIPQ